MEEHLDSQGTTKGVVTLCAGLGKILNIDNLHKRHLLIGVIWEKEALIY